LFFALSQLEDAGRLLDAGRCAEALPLAARLAAAPAPSPQLALFRTFALEARGEAEHCLGRSAAERTFREVLSARRELLPRAHPHTARAMANLATVLASRRQPYEAEELLREAISVWQLKDPPDAVSIAAARNVLATLHQQLEDPDGALRELDKAWQSLPAAAPAALRAAISHNLAVIHCQQGRAADSARWFDLSLRLALQAWGEDHPRLAAMLRNYAAALRGARRKPEARALEQRARAIERPLRGHR
jgi:tetratricopeptide (TPR) repeat protein